MKILSINKFYFIFGGSDRYFFEMNSLLEQAGHTVIPFAMVHPRNEATPYNDYFVSRVDFWNPSGAGELAKSAGRVLYSSEANSKVRQLIEDTQPDVAHIHSIYHQISPSILPVIQEYEIPIIQTLHDYKPICPTYRLISGDKICERCRGKKFYNAILQRCNNGSITASGINAVEMYLHHGLGWYDLPTVYHTPSKFLMDKMIEFGMPAEKFVHVPLFIDLDKYSDGYPEKPYFIYFGRLAPVKGVKTLLEAMTLLKNKNARLKIVGEGPQEPELIQFRQNKDLENVDFLGYLDSSGLWPLVGQSQFTVLPSEWYEIFGLTVLESMALGRPVIGANIGGIPELIDHEKTGLLFPPGDAKSMARAIDRMIESDTERAAMGAAARSKVEANYSAERHYEKIIPLYERALNQKS